MTKSRRLNVRVPRDELVVLQVRVYLCIQSPRNNLRPPSVTNVTGRVSSLLDTFPHEIISADVGIHYLVVLIRDRRVLAIFTIEAKSHSIALRRIISVTNNNAPNKSNECGKCNQSFCVCIENNTTYSMCMFVPIMNVVTENYFIGVNNG